MKFKKKRNEKKKLFELTRVINMDTKPFDTK